MSNIFKIYINKNNIFYEVYLFIKNKYLIESKILPDIDELNKDYSNFEIFINSEIYKTHFINDFNDDDINFMQTSNSKIIFIDDIINIDDTIETIKFKIINHYNKNIEEDKKICFEEIYMYCLTKQKLDVYKIHDSLSYNNKIMLTRNNFIEYLTNIYESYEIINTLENKETYSIDDLKNIKINYIKEYIPLGQTFIVNKNNNNFIVNPYNYKNVSSKLLGDYIVTNNSNLLFEYNIYNNTIIICLANNFFNNNVENIDEENIMKLYFNFLYSKNIINKNNFITQKSDLLKNTKLRIENTNYINKNNFINLLNKIYNNSDSLKYENFGIKYININIHTNISFNISLESIFKLFNSSELYPFIKYNPGKKLENIYRIYCNKINNRKKFPLLNKSIILKYAKFLGKTNTISFYVNSVEELFTLNVNEFLIELEDSGIINVKINFKNILDLNNINELILKNVNPIIKFIKKLVVNNNIELFDDLLNKNVEINSINYISNINIKGNLSLKNLNSCINYLFNIINNNTNEIIMRYKHVSNFSIMNSEDSFILELIKQKFTESEIINKMQENFKITLDDAKFKLISVINSLKLVQNTFNYKKIKIKNNPGFLTSFKKTSSQNLLISIDNIDNINYLDTIPLYIDSIVKILFNSIKNDNIVKEIKNICKKELQVNETKENKVIDIEKHNLNETIVNHLMEEEDDNIDDNNDLLNILLDDDSDNDDFEDEEYDDITNYEEDEIKNDSKNEKLIDDNAYAEDNNDVLMGEYSKNDILENEDNILDESEKLNTIKEKSKEHIQNKFEEMQEEKPDNDDSKEEFKEISEKSNPILKRLINKEPKLFTTDKNKFFTEYSRLCPANVKKQPVILTKEEKDYIDLNHRNSYTESYEYGTQEGNKYYYICPRYWDLEKNISLTHEDVISEKYGKVITKKNKDGTFDGNIMEFTDKKYHVDEKNNYVDHSPGFLDEKHNRNGFCLPCCFNNKLWSKPQQKERRNKCLNLNYKLDAESNKDYFNYIKGPDKFPLEKNKIGFLPISIQKFLQFDNNNCVTKQASNILKTNNPCLLRYGVENSSNQSFIACIADLFKTLVLNNSKSININEMKNIIKNSISLDNFIKYNNGNLPHIFISKNILELIDSIDILKYKNTILYKQLIENFKDKNDVESKIIMFKKIINSYENFKKYLESDMIINYTYLWDIICKSNKLLFSNGLNLIILDITHEDITDNVKLICPKQSYSDEFLDIKKKCFILIKKDEYYEPIYLINNTVDYHITKVFNFTDIKEESNLKNFKIILNKIKNAINEKCIAKIDNKKYLYSTYNFKNNIELDKVISILINLNYEVTYQIIDYSNKVIGVLIDNSYESGFIPCYPSSLSSNHDSIPYKLIDELEEKEYNDFNNTKILLEKIYNLSNYKIVCKPIYKIIDDNLIVGILTLGNQFVMISKPEINNTNDLEEINNKNYVFIDKNIQVNNKKDEERIQQVNNIKLETEFYNNFKNTFKKILNIHNNIYYKNLLLKIINNNTILYLDKLNNIYNLLKEIGDKYIIFSNYDKKILNNIKNISMCIDSEKCNTNFCMKKNDICSLIIPKKNLINNENNEELYYFRLADEFIRYNNFKNFIFKDNNSLNYSSFNYNILPNELILFQSSLTSEYFKDLLENNNNNNTLDIFETLGYENNNNNLNLKNIKKPLREKIIITTTKEKIKNIKNYLNKDTEDSINEEDTEDSINEEDTEDSINETESVFILNNFIDKEYECIFTKNLINDGFHINFKEQIYEFTFPIDNKICSFQLILILIKYHNKKETNLNIIGLKNKLFELYSKHPNLESLYYILLKNNKKIIMENVINKTTKFEDLLYSEEYYITYIDIYLLAKEYNLPIILICNTTIDLSITEENYIICNLNRINNNYYFIKIPSKYSRKKIHNYKLIYNKKSFKFDINNDILDSSNYKLYSKLLNETKLFINPLEKYIYEFDLGSATKSKYIKKLPKKFEIKKNNELKKEVIEEEEEETDEKIDVQKQKRCPNGTRRNKKTGECEKI